MEPLGSFPRVLNVLPREKIEGPPRARGFLAFGLAEDVAKRSPLENSEGGLQYSSKGVQ